MHAMTSNAIKKSLAVCIRSLIVKDY